MSSSRWQRVLVAAALSLTSAGVARADEPTTCTAPDTTLAERRAGEAFEAYGKGEYPKAVTLYLDAYAACPTAPILYNLARIHDTKLDKREQAIVFYRRYVASVDARPDLVVAARKRLEELEPTKLSPSAVAKTAPSERGLDEAHEGHARSASPHVAASQAGWSNQRWLGAILGASGVVGLGLGSAFGMLARSHANTAHQMCDGNVCRTQEGVDAAKAGQRDATISNVGFAAGTTLLLTGVVLYVTGGEHRSENTESARLHLGPRAETDAWAMELGGTW